MNINLMAPINQLGYGVVGLNIFKALCDVANVSLFPIGQPQVTSQHDADAVKAGLAKAQFFDADAPCLKVWHQNQMSEFIGRGEHIGFPIFELDTFTDVERHNLTSVDKLFVCSQWAKDVCDPLCVSTYVVPLGVDANIFPPHTTPREDGKTIFFNCGKWEIRKGHDILIEAFKKVAESHENVELWMMCENPFNSPEEEHKWASLYNYPKVKLIPRAETQAEVYNIMCKTDCGVFPSRGEGWNLELLEMMSIGKHVIATNYSAHTEFCTQENCDLVTITDKEPAFDGKWFFGQGNWAKIEETQILQLQQYMEAFHERGQSCHEQINRSGIETATKFSWENTATVILENL
jgi:glycosyltransferase involved in cell wall biosynthesis